MVVVDAAPERLETRIADALVVCIARVGLAHSTAELIAREAGCSRATLYRHFDGKAAIVRHAVAQEIERMTSVAVDAGLDAPTFEDAVVAVTTTAARELTAHDALWFLLVHEPESILSHLAFAEGDRVLVEVGDALAPAFARWLAPTDARRAGEWIARVLRSYVLMPEPSIDLTDLTSARELLCELVVPGLAATPRAGSRTGGSHG